MSVSGQVPKLLRGERPEQVIKELLKYLQKQGPDGGSGGGGKKVLSPDS